MYNYLNNPTMVNPNLSGYGINLTAGYTNPYNNMYGTNSSLYGQSGFVFPGTSSTNSGINNGINTGNNFGGYATNPVNQTDSGCTDGVDDGKISFGEKAKNFVKGVFSPITNMFKSPKNFIKGAAMIAGGVVLCAATGGAAAPFLVAAGVVGGGIQVAKGAIKASNATTDMEAKEAWHGIGAGTGTVAASVIGSKAALKGAGVNTEGMNLFQTTIGCFKYSANKVGSLMGGGAAAAGAGTAGTNTSGTKGQTQTEAPNTQPNNQAGATPNPNTTAAMTPEEAANSYLEEMITAAKNGDKQAFRTAYRNAAKQFHPDAVAQRGGTEAEIQFAEEVMKIINNQYESIRV